MKKRLQLAREKRIQQAKTEGRVIETIESVGLIFEGRSLFGQHSYEDGTTPTGVQKNVFEIGIRIDF